MGTVLSNPDLLFGDHRDIFVNVIILGAYILSLPVAIMRTSEAHDYDRPPGLYVATIIIVIIGCLLHIATCIRFKSELEEKDRRSDILYLIASGILTIGATLLLIFGGVYATEHCNVIVYDEEVTENYTKCWWNAFASFLAQSLMVLYLVMLIIANRYGEKFGWDRCCHIFRKVLSMYFVRAMTLIVSNIFAITQLLTFPELYDEANLEYRNWVYFNTAFILVTVILSALNVFTGIGELWESMGHNTILTVWFVASLASWAAGCLTYRMIELTWEGGAAHFGENLFWTFCNVWLFTESLAGLVEEDVKYEPIDQKL